MKLTLGIVGLPNVGKSTLFNALTNQKIPAENYPFCTIDPNVGVVEVHDQRLQDIASIVNPEEVIPAVVEFVDIAGIVKGAHEGEGLGNKFLANIREVDAIVHVVRAFDDTNVIHVEGKVEPKSDIEIINAELILKDLETIESRLVKAEKAARGDKDEISKLQFIKDMKEHLEKGKLAVDLESFDEDIRVFRKELSLLTDKKVIYILNTVDRMDDTKARELTGLVDSDTIIQMDIKTEYEISSLEPEEREEYVNELGLEITGLQKLSQIAYDALGLISFFTAGEKEVRAWTIEKGMNIKNAAGVIHNDFTKNFIAADVISYKDFLEHSGWEGGRDAGKVRLEGKDYIVKDGDVVIIKHNS